MASELQLPVVHDLRDLIEMWQLWDNGGDHPILARRLDGDRYVAVIPFLFTWGVVVGRVAASGTLSSQIYDDRWCYGSLNDAVMAASRWTGDGEPDGWHRHVDSGRRRPDGDPEREYINH